MDAVLEDVQPLCFPRMRKGQALLLGQENWELGWLLESFLLGSGPAYALLLGPAGAGKSSCLDAVQAAALRMGQPKPTLWHPGHHGPCRLLLVDDLHTLPPRAHRQLSQAIDQAQSVLITSRTSPLRLVLSPTLADRLTQFATVPIRPPRPTTRVQLLRHFTQLHRIPTPERTLFHLARHWRAYPGTLEQQLLAFAQGIPVPSSACHTEPVTLEAICRATTRFYQMPEQQLTAHTRQRRVVHARRMAIHLARRLTNSSLAEIGSALGGLDHTTVLYHYRTLQNLLQHNPRLRRELQQLEQELRRQLAPKKNPMPDRKLSTPCKSTSRSAIARPPAT